MMRFVAACLLSVPALAQTTHIVDATGGPGVFTTLAAAHAASIPGDTILVRPTAVYDFSLTTSMGLTILGAGPGPTSFRGRILLNGLPFTQRFVMRGFVGQPPGPTSSEGGMHIFQCLGAVVLEDVVLQGPMPGSATALSALAIMDAEHVSLHRCTCFGNGGLTVTSFASVVAASECNFIALAGNATTGMTCFGGRTYLTNCQLIAPIGLEVAFGNGPALVTMAGGATGSAGTATAAARVLAGTLRIDSAVTLNGATMGTIVPYEGGRPSLTLAPAGLASTAVFDGPAGAFGALALGLPAWPAPTPLGDLWLDPQAYVVIAFGTPPLQVSFVTPLAATRGLPLVAQGALLHLGSFGLSGPIRALVP